MDTHSDMMVEQKRAGAKMTETETLVRPLKKYYDPVLTTRTVKFDFFNPPIDPIQLAHILAQSVIHYKGIGIAAPQLGLPYRVFAMKANPVFVCFNPLIIDTSDHKEIMEEGCLTLPGMLVNKSRHSVIKVRYTEANGNVVTNKFQGMTARVFQHEMEHLDGKLLISGMSRTALTLLANKAKKNGHAYDIGRLVVTSCR